jgi:hypothetical protein
LRASVRPIGEVRDLDRRTLVSEVGLAIVIQDEGTCLIA